MGSSSSKPARKLASKVTENVAKNAPKPQMQPNSAAQRYAPSGHREQATKEQMAQSSENKTREIMRDAGDPQLLQNLNKIGQVHVPKHSTNFQPTDQMLRILHAREEASMEHLAEQPSSSKQPSRITANTLTYLLDDRKHCTSEADLKKLAVEYDMPLEEIQALATYFTSPTMGEEIKDEQGDRESIEKGGEKRQPKVRAEWVEPKMSTVQIGQAPRSS